MRSWAITLAALCLSSCGEKAADRPQPQNAKTAAAASLDEQAVRSGILPDPQNISLAGQYETRSDLGTDKFCATQSESNYAIGVLAVFGPESKCEGQGTASLENGKVRVTLTSEESCSFLADYDGVALRFPGELPKSCASYCSSRASLAGTGYYLVSEGDKAARNTLGRDIERLCQ